MTVKWDCWTSPFPFTTILRWMLKVIFIANLLQAQSQNIRHQHKKVGRTVPVIRGASLAMGPAVPGR